MTTPSKPRRWYSKPKTMLSKIPRDERGYDEFVESAALDVAEKEIAELEAEVARLKEIEFMYKGLCK